MHLVGDTVQSLGVIIAATVIYFKPDWNIVDPICTFFFSVIVIFTTIPITRDCIAILMEGILSYEISLGTPRKINIDLLRTDILKLPNVTSIHDLHVWSLTNSKMAMSAHIRTTTPSSTLTSAITICQKHNIMHSTIQVENIKEDHLFNSV